MLGSCGPARHAFAQATATPSSGEIAGVVNDQEDHRPLPNARLGVYHVTPGDSAWTLVHGALAGEDGTFRFQVPPGTYRFIASYQSYTPVVRDDIHVEAGGRVELTLALTPRPIQVQGVDVKGAEARNSEATSLAKQKRAEYVSDAITAEQISKSTDSNAAEALQRVTGLSVVQGRYVYVRGLGERYSSTQVNGASVGTPEPNKRVVPLDVFPSGALDNIVVQKSYTPDQEGEFAGGVINLNTRDFVEGRSFTQTISTGYAAKAVSRKFMSYDGGSLDFLGFDDGTRDTPNLIRTLAGDKRIVGTGAFGGDGFTREQIQAMGRSFNRVWSPEGRNGRPNYSYAASFARGFRLFGREVGFLGAFSLSNSFNTVTRDHNAYAGTSTSLTPLYLYRVEESSSRVLGGGLTNLSFRPWQGQAIRLRSLYTRNSEDNARVTQGPNFDYGTDLVRITNLDFVERGLFSTVLSGEHRITPLGGWNLEWRGSYSATMRDEPDRRESVYESNGLGGVQLSGRSQYPLTRIFGDMNEYDRSVAGDVRKSFHALGAREFKVKAGGAFRHRNRVSSFRRFGFTLGALGRSSLDRSLPPESLLVEENIKPGYFELAEATKENDTYHATQEIRAWYGMLETSVLRRLELTGGVRVETSDQAVESKSPFVTTEGPVDVRLEDTDLLPALNATLRFTDAMSLRGGFSVTVSRPELREMSPFSMYDYETGYSEIGNPSIQSTRIENYDARWEFYPGPRELFAVSGFRKTMYQPIENVVEGSSGGYVLSPRNGRDGRLKGVEVEGRIGFSRAWNAVATLLPIVPAPPVLEHFAVSLNYSRVSSSVRVRTTTDANFNPVYREGPLQGQAASALNAGLYFGADGIDGSILYSAFGRRLAQVGAGAYPNSLPDIYEYPANGLDVSFGKRVSNWLNVKLSIENILMDDVEFRQLDLVTRRSNPGRSFSLSFNAKN